MCCTHLKIDRVYAPIPLIPQQLEIYDTLGNSHGSNVSALNQNAYLRLIVHGSVF